MDGHKVRKVLRRVGSEARFETVARMFQVLSDPTRAKLLFAMAQEELCVCDLATYYSLADDHIRHLVEDGLRHAEED